MGGTPTGLVVGLMIQRRQAGEILVDSARCSVAYTQRMTSINFSRTPHDGHC
ncbi:MAG TPA: hypothetical protein VJ914_00440 [Pseudonocardiaceae bacterium]|nr:hypothetical protein [Pseudonocardiaceae bacterium]